MINSTRQRKVTGLSNKALSLFTKKKKTFRVKTEQKEQVMKIQEIVNSHKYITNVNRLSEGINLYLFSFRAF